MLRNTFQTTKVFKTETATLLLLPTPKFLLLQHKSLKKEHLLIQNGKVIGAGNNIAIPKNCITINLEGKSIYPSFIDIYTDFGIEKPKANPNSGRNPLYDTKRSGYYWNENVLV